MFTVFVYGTLREGGSNHRLLKSAKKIGEAVATGEMFMGPGYPFAYFAPEFQPEGPYILGELYSVDERTLERLDALEGYDETHPEMSHYIRREITTHVPVYGLGEMSEQVVDLTEEEVSAWAYQYNAEVRNRESRLIKSGDFLKELPAWRGRNWR